VQGVPRCRKNGAAGPRRRAHRPLSPHHLPLTLSITRLLPLFFFSTLHDSTITFFQQVGFASLELGSVRAKNTRNILLKVRQMKKKERE
jgi:hypothetical protein